MGGDRPSLGGLNSCRIPAVKNSSNLGQKWIDKEAIPRDLKQKPKRWQKVRCRGGIYGVLNHISFIINEKQTLYSPKKCRYFKFFNKIAMYYFK
jgi:hypothetical protein